VNEMNFLTRTYNYKTKMTIIQIKKNPKANFPPKSDE
jgi:hypothetical protein